MVQKGFGPSEGRGKRAEGREKREERRDIESSGWLGSRDRDLARPRGQGEERREKREERREKRDESIKKTEEGGEVKKGFGP